jgi:2-oxoglutarate dehydrogenase E2 component (dihydrolipoamide succinyltransferase)
MAIIEVKVPQLSESVAEATLLAWHKKAGDAVTRDENLVDVETDKVVLELPAPDSGVLIEIVEGDGSTVTSNQLIARIDTAATAGATAPAAKPAAAAAPAPAPAAGSAPLAMPSAAKIMAEQGVNPANVAGTGKDGRITKGDALAAGSAPAAAPAPAAKPAAAPLAAVKAQVNLQFLGERPEQRVPMSRLRQRVAQRLLESQSTNAILTTFNEVNMQPVIDLRKKYGEKFEKEHGV